MIFGFYFCYVWLGLDLLINKLLRRAAVLRVPTDHPLKKEQQDPGIEGTPDTAVARQR